MQVGKKNKFGPSYALMMDLQLEQEKRRGPKLHVGDEVTIGTKMVNPLVAC